MSNIPENNLPEPDVQCAVCNSKCILESLKCQKCKRYTHTDCTRLPVYAIANLFNTRCQYTCENCVRTQLGERGDSQFALVIDLIEKEKEVKVQQKIRVCEKEGESEDEDQSSESVSDHDNMASPAKQTYKQTSDVRKICFFYKQNRCKFGRKGSECPFAHPRLCYKYKNYGRDSHKGCKDGGKCPYLHPPICYGSERGRECLNSQCKRLHLKGTRRYPATQQQTQQIQQTTNPAKECSPIDECRQVITDQTLPDWSNPVDKKTRPYIQPLNLTPIQAESRHLGETVTFLVKQMQQV